MRSTGDVITFEGPNDIEMMREAGGSLASAHSQESVKTVATNVSALSHVDPNFVAVELNTWTA